MQHPPVLQAPSRLRRTGPAAPPESRPGSTDAPPVGWCGDGPALRHQGAGSARLRAARPRERHDLRLRSDGAVRSAHRPPARRAELRHPAPLARAPLRPRHVRAQRHRHRRQGARERDRRRAVVGARVSDGAGVLARVCRDRHPPADLRAARHRVHPADAGAHRAAHRRGARLRRARRRVLRRALVAVDTARSRASRSTRWSRRRMPIRAASATRATSRCGRARRPTSPRPRPWDSPWGRRPARLAHRVLRDVAALPRPGVRHPRRRARPALPAPRERAGPVDRGRRRRSPGTGCTTAS